MLLFKRPSGNITTSFVRNWTSKNQAATTGSRKSSQWQNINMSSPKAPTIPDLTASSDSHDWCRKSRTFSYIATLPVSKALIHTACTYPKMGAQEGERCGTTTHRIYGWHSDTTSENSQTSGSNLQWHSDLEQPHRQGVRKVRPKSRDSTEVEKNISLPRTSPHLCWRCTAHHGVCHLSRRGFTFTLWYFFTNAEKPDPFVFVFSNAFTIVHLWISVP